MGLGSVLFAVTLDVAVRYAKSSSAPATSNAGDPTPMPATPNVPFSTLPMRGSEPGKVASTPKSGAPSAAKEGLEWSVADLAKFLKEKGCILDYEVGEDSLGIPQLGRPREPAKLAKLKISNDDMQEVRKVSGKLTAEQETKPRDYVNYLAYPSRKFSWGRFVFLSTTEEKAAKLLSPLRGVIIGHYEEAYKPTFRDFP